MEVTKFRCEMCSQEIPATENLNGGWLVLHSTGGFTLKGKAFLPEDGEDKHFCSPACAGKYMLGIVNDVVEARNG